jgi:uncharacterized protein YdhG (YjbR/CyaY superfamily)
MGGRYSVTRAMSRCILNLNMQSKATTVAEYLGELPEDRRAAISKVRQVIRKNLPRGIVEGMQYGMIGYFVPHKIYPAGYHCDPKQPLPFAGLASQKGHMSLYLCTLYQNAELEAWFKAKFAEAGKKLDMGKGCVRFKKLDDLPLDVVGEAMGRMTVEEVVANYDAQRTRSKAARKG